MLIKEFVESLTVEEKKKILNLIPSWKIGNQILPLYTLKGPGNKVNLLNLRNELLKKRLPGELKLMSYCQKLFPDIVFQYPIIITNQQLWVEKLNLLGLLKNHDYVGRRAFYIDGYSPTRNIIVEADYPTTHDDRYDIARDIYLREMYGIKINRIREYGKDREIDIGIEKNLHKLTLYSKSNTPYIIDYSTYAIENYLIFNYPALYDSLSRLFLGQKPGPTYEKVCKLIGRK